MTTEPSGLSGSSGPSSSTSSSGSASSSGPSSSTSSTSSTSGWDPPPRRPLDAVPARRPGSVRRSMHVDVGARTEWGAALPIVSGARDLRTAPDGSVTVLAEARVEAAFDPARCLVEARSTPPVDWLDDLIGTRAGGGFRRRLEELVPPSEAGSLVRQVLDDMPAGVLISGYAFMRLARRQGLAPSSLTPPDVLDRMVDLCSGWRAGGVATRSIGSGHGVPMQDCPPAPELVGLPFARRSPEPGQPTHVMPETPTTPTVPTVQEAGDPWAWHDMEPLPSDHMRRRRCLDVVSEDDGSFSVWAMFRDTVGEPHGGEAVLHEYAVEARGRDGILTEVRADPRVLPFPECPGAAGPVSALVGTALADLPAAVPETLVGIGSCTHLNDLLRALGGLAGLLEGARHSV